MGRCKNSSCQPGAKFGGERAKANELGDRLAKLGLIDEAVDYWEKSAFLDLGSRRLCRVSQACLKNRRITRNAKRFLTAAWSR